MKTLLLSILILTVTGLRAQTFVETGISSNGVALHLSIGHEFENGIELNLGYNAPGVNVDRHPFVKSLVAGYNIPVNDFYVTPSIGVAAYLMKDLTEFNKGGPVITTNGAALISRIQFGKEYSNGLYRLFVNANYCKVLYFDIGCRLNFNKL